MSYYTTNIIIICIALAVLCILVYENDRIPRKDKTPYYLTYIVVALAAISEWLGIHFNGDATISPFLLRIIKCADYILTPTAAAALVSQLKHKSIWKTIILFIIGLNFIFQIISIFTTWMITIDNGNNYSHGNLYNIYILIFLVLLALVIIDLLAYGLFFRKQNRPSLFATAILLIAGTLFQIFLGQECRTAYIAITMALALLFIHNTEFSQQVSDDRIKSQEYDLMMSQIKPHFIFNCLAAIRGTYHADVEKGDTAISHFSSYLRHNIDALENDAPASFSEELKHVEEYLSLQKLRFEDDLKIEFDLECKDFMIPRLTLEPIVENAVSHGALKQEEHQGVVIIRTVRKPDSYEISVIDNGPGFKVDDIAKNDERLHIGIKNVKDRLQRSCGGTLKINSEEGKGTSVTISIPKTGADFK